jgi:plant G-box-binding factor
MQGVPYPTSEAVATVAAATAPEGKGKGKGGGASPEKGSSGAPSGEDDSRRYRLSLLPCQRCSFKFFSPLPPFLVKFNSNAAVCSSDSGSDESSETRDDDTDHKVPINLLCHKGPFLNCMFFSCN